MASTSTSPGDLLSSSSQGHDTLGGHDVAVTEDTTAVAPCRETSPGAIGVVMTDVAGTAESQRNGETVHCQIIMTDDAGDEISLLRPQEQSLNSKMKLVRCRAVYDDASPSPTPPPPPPGVVTMEPLDEDSSTAIRSPSGRSSLNVSPAFQVNLADRTTQGQPGPTAADGGPSPAMSRDSSVDYTDSTAGASLEDFIIKTLNKNKPDRVAMLRLESDMTAFINDTGKEKWKFPPMTSYFRMLTHRVAAFFQLDHNVDEHGKCVVISRLPVTRVPDFKFREYLRDDFLSDDQPKKSILKRHRDCNSLEENFGVDRILIGERKSKSFEERTEEYREARSRIFREMPNGSTESSTSLKEDGGDVRDADTVRDGARLPSDGRPFRVDDPVDHIADPSQSQVAVASFHSVTVLNRGDGQTSTASGSGRCSKTDAVGSVASNTGTTITSPPPPHPPPIPSSLPPDGEAGGDGPSSGSPFLPFTDDRGEPLAIWVASTINQIPPGSIIINPKKGEPYTNPDGSLYRWYPPMHLLGKGERPGSEGLAVEHETSTAIDERPFIEPQRSKDVVKAAPCGASVTIESQTDKVGSSSGAAPQAPASVLPAPLSAKAPSFIQTYTTASGAIAPDRRAVPPPVIVPSYSAASASIPGASVRFVCPQAVAYPAAPGLFDQQCHVPEEVPYGYLTTYPTDPFQVNSYPLVGVPLPSAETYQQFQPHMAPQPLTVVQYTDKTWDQYQQPMTLLPGRGSVAGQVYYDAESSLRVQGAIPSQAHQCSVQLVAVSSASAAGVNHGQPVMFAGQGSVHPTYLANGQAPSGTQPQYIQYAYHQQIGGAAVPVMPLYQNVVSVTVPVAASGLPLPQPPPRGPTPCLVPVLHPPAPVNIRPLSHQSLSAKPFQFSVPPPPSGVPPRMSSVNLPIRPRDSDPIRADVGSHQVRMSNRPAFNPRQARFGSGLQPQNNIAFSHPMNPSAADTRGAWLHHQRMAPPSLPSNFHQKPRLAVANVSNTSAVPAASLARKLSAAPQPHVGVSAGSVVLEVCGVPPTMSRHKVNTYLADLTAFGAKEFHVQDGPHLRPKDGTCVGSAAVVAVFDSASSAQRALRDHRGSGYRLQAAYRAYNPSHRS